jgi:hypothetical protein
LLLLLVRLYPGVSAPKPELVELLSNGPAQAAAQNSVIAHLADHVPCGWMTTTFLIRRFIHCRLVLWNKHHQAHPVAERKSRIRSKGPIHRTKTHSRSWKGYGPTNRDGRCPLGVGVTNPTRPRDPTYMVTNRQPAIYPIPAGSIDF